MHQKILNQNPGQNIIFFSRPQLKTPYKSKFFVEKKTIKWHNLNLRLEYWLIMERKKEL